MLVKTRAIVVGTVKYGDRKVIVDMFTEARGRLSFIASVSSSPQGRLRKLYLQPLTLLDLEFDDRANHRLLTIRELHPFAPYVSMQTHIDRKSTRLNSSHANISYAVFCLKKKNNT